MGPNFIRIEAKAENEKKSRSARRKYAMVGRHAGNWAMRRKVICADPCSQIWARGEGVGVHDGWYDSKENMEQ